MDVLLKEQRQLINPAEQQNDHENEVTDNSSIKASAGSSSSSIMTVVMQAHT